MYLAKVGPTRGTTLLLESSKTYNNPRKHAFCVCLCLFACVCGEAERKGEGREEEGRG